MRTITASLFTTVDGVVEAPVRRCLPSFGEEMGPVGSLTRDVRFLGRTSGPGRGA